MMPCCKGRVGYWRVVRMRWSFPELFKCPLCSQEIRTTLRWGLFPVHLVCTTAVYLACKWLFGIKGISYGADESFWPWFLYWVIAGALTSLAGAPFTEYHLKNDPLFRNRLIADHFKSCPFGLLLLDILFIGPVLGMLLVGEAIK